MLFQIWEELLNMWKLCYRHLIIVQVMILIVCWCWWVETAVAGGTTSFWVDYVIFELELIVDCACAGDVAVLLLIRAIGCPTFWFTCWVQLILTWVCSMITPIVLSSITLVSCAFLTLSSFRMELSGTKLHLFRARCPRLWRRL